jgi:hypothetical protein
MRDAVVGCLLPAVAAVLLVAMGTVEAFAELLED